MEFTARLTESIVEAEAVLAIHQPIGGGMCACGRSLPCPVAAAWSAHAELCRTRIDHAMTILAPRLLLPVIEVAA